MHILQKHGRQKPFYILLALSQREYGGMLCVYVWYQIVLTPGMSYFVGALKTLKVKVFMELWAKWHGGLWYTTFGSKTI